MAGGPNLQGMDSLTAAMQNNIVPDQEYLLQVPFCANQKEIFNPKFFIRSGFHPGQQGGCPKSQTEGPLRQRGHGQGDLRREGNGLLNQR